MGSSIPCRAIEDCWGRGIVETLERQNLAARDVPQRRRLPDFPSRAARRMIAQGACV